jgi:hypothetical protein
MTTTELPSGIYRIVLPGGVLECLTRLEETGVTVLPCDDKPEQEVTRRFLTSSIICRSPALLVANCLW